MENKQFKGHVIVVPYPSQGHINPLLQFAKRLASKGVKATLATTRYTVGSICAPQIGVEAISDGFDEGGYSQAGNVEFYLKSFREQGSRTLTRLIHKFKHAGTPVTCVVYDSFLPWALDVAKQQGIHCASFFTNSAAVCSIFSRIHHGLLALPLTPETTPLMLPGLPPLNFRDLPTFLRFPDSYPAYLAMKLSQFTTLNQADWVFANTFEDLETEEAKGASELWRAKMIGPMVPSAYLDERIKGDRSYGSSLWKPLSEECMEWLETKPSKSVVYISFGSMVSLTEEEMEEIAGGLKESNLHYLWIVRKSEQKKLPKWFLDLNKEKGMVVTWCNQLEMLSHPAVGCFVTHCGWNSTLEGLSLGVPMIGVPKWADQLTDAKFVEEIWGIGVRAKEDEEGVVRKEELIKCFKEVMEGERSKEFKRNANKWKEIAKTAISEGGSFDETINDFVQQLTAIAKAIN
ncbi:UDP-glycosyltransferase 74B1 [Hibiscus syriacus]|uniref:Glycosyltransferase n=1 Tax=Hibiscus syriacus TaxID=106335 RepID=A0A6A3CG07_HIBSY|nr:UDP-glycosyltransferase 74B1-like [Hibiscus syriacus]KAE8726079.1 UDP-glycosyltransferase 74B1 [Hibiscus syriacus]